MVKLGWIKVLRGGCARGGRGGSTSALLEAETRDDGQDVGRPHLGLTAADGGHFRFVKKFGSTALFQGMNDYLKIGLGQNSGYRGNGRSSVIKATR